MKRALFLFLYIAGLAGGGVLTWLGIQTVRAELQLRDRAAVAEAKVTDAATYGRPHDTGESLDYEVRYAFHVPGRTETFTFSDETGRTDLWAALTTKAEWEAVRAANSLQVVYVPRNPWINRPVLSKGMPLGDALAGLILGAVIGLSCLIGATVLVRRMLR